MFRLVDTNSNIQLSNVAPFIGYTKKGNIYNNSYYYEANASAIFIGSKLSSIFNKFINNPNPLNMAVLNGKLSLKSNPLRNRGFNLFIQPKVLYSISNNSVIDYELLTSLEIELLPFCNFLIGYGIKNSPLENVARMGIKFHDKWGSLLLYGQSSEFSNFFNPKLFTEIFVKEPLKVEPAKEAEKPSSIIPSSLMGFEMKFYLKNLNLLAYGNIGTSNTIATANAKSFDDIKAFGYTLACALELTGTKGLYFSISAGLKSDIVVAEKKNFNSAYQDIHGNVFSGIQYRDEAPTNNMNAVFFALNYGIKF